MRKYSAEDLKVMTWQQYGELVDKLVNDVKVLDKEFDIIAPILRGGAMPAVALANKLDIVSMLPIQLKYNNDWNITEKLKHQTLPHSDPNAIYNVLLVDNFTYSGDSAIKAAEIIKSLYPNSKISFATTVNILNNQEKLSTFEHFITAQSKSDTGELSGQKVDIYPFQDPERELRSLNGEAE